MGKAQEEMDQAVNAGYWNLYRYNPGHAAEGKNPFTLDSKEPDWTKFQEFLKSEVRFSSRFTGIGFLVQRISSALNLNVAIIVDIYRLK